MKIDKKVSFYSNTPDDTHCFQAVVKMLLKYYFPKENYSWEQLDNITAKVKDLWTWPMAGFLWLKEKGLEVRMIEIFDYGEFAERGKDYLREFYGEDVAKAQIKHSDIQQERKLAKEFIKKVKIENRLPDVQEIKNLLTDNYIISCNVNSRRLNNKDGYAGHFVIIKGFDNKHFFIHDPGLPPLENRKITCAKFHEAWTYPDENVKNISAFKKK